jgi:AcrR family transcriptional regulator
MNAAATAKASTAKGEETRAQILEAAMQMASEGGFESITIGSLAEKTGLSKSGLFAHFGSRTELQIATLDESARRFTEVVFLPALKAPRGLKRLRSLFDHWLVWTDRVNLPGGCPLDAAGREYDHRPGPMRDAVIERERVVMRELAKAVHMAVETGELKKDTDAAQFCFEFMAIVMAFYRAQLSFGKDAAVKRAGAAFDRLIGQARA